MAEDRTLTLAPVEQAADLLADLLALRWQGLHGPLSFFPETALAWVENGYGSAFDQAWSGDRNPASEQERVSVRIAFRGREPLGEAFEAAARRILQPLLDRSETVKTEKDST